MKKLNITIKRVMLVAPLVLIAGASLMPLKAGAQQALVLLTLIWYFAILFTGAAG